MVEIDPTLQAELAEQRFAVDPLEAQPFNQWSTEQPVKPVRGGLVTRTLRTKWRRFQRLKALEGGAGFDAGELAADLAMGMGELAEGMLMEFL